MNGSRFPLLHCKLLDVFLIVVLAGSSCIHPAAHDNTSSPAGPYASWPQSGAPWQLSPISSTLYHPFTGIYARVVTQDEPMFFHTRIRAFKCVGFIYYFPPPIRGQREAVPFDVTGLGTRYPTLKRRRPLWEFTWWDFDIFCHLISCAQDKPP